MCMSRDPVFEFWDPLISRERLKLETSNLARIRAAVSSDEENTKLGQKWSCGVTWPSFGILGPPLLSHERLKLETSNLAWRRMAASSNKENAKLGQKEPCWSHVTHFWNFGTSFYLRNGWSYKLQNLALRMMTMCINNAVTGTFFNILCYTRQIP